MLPLLWLSGTSAAGKSTVAWELFTRLTAAGVDAGFVDIDQLGMCYGPPAPGHWAPEPAGDHGRHLLQARTLDALAVNFRAAGVCCLLVSGVTDPARGVETALVPHAAVTSCLLHADEADLARRLAARNHPGDDLANSVAHAATLKRTFPDALWVDTTGLTVAEVADRVLARTGWPPPAPAAEPPVTAAEPPGPPLSAPTAEPPGLSAEPPGLSAELPEPPALAAEPPGSRLPATPGDVLWVCGPAAIGKSTIGWQVYHQLRLAGVNAAFVDLDQIGFRRPAHDTDPGNHRLKAANLAAVWRSFRDAGADCLVAVGPLDRPRDLATYRAALPATTLTLCRLTASPQTLAERAARRGRGETPAALAGDELTGRPAAHLAEVAARSAENLRALAGLGGLEVGTDGRPAADIAAEIIAKNRYPPGGGCGTLAP
ncbi:hypothetical protein AB0F81_17825 [Actinoplanes sp. NPDC024001]|uniref:hypothetical protein n=1 Tax=Actinoplanes sp. NPDC024001 TaxID=3154598 RepID=UPI0033C92F54